MVEYDARQNPIHKISSEDLNYLLADSYKVDDDIHPTVENKPISREIQKNLMV